MQFNTKFFGVKKSAIVKKHETKCREILTQVARMESAQDQIVERLRNIPVLETPDVLRSASPQDYIKRDVEYHIENIYIRIVMIFDRCYLLVNDEYKLGAVSKDCNYELLKKKIKNEEVFKILEDWGNKIKSWQYRNFLTHEGHHIDLHTEEVFEKNFKLDFGLMGMWASDHPNYEPQNELRKKQQKENWEKAVLTINQGIKGVMEKIDDFLTEFFNELDKRIEQ